MMQFFLRENKNGKLRLRIFRSLLVLILTLVILKSVIEIGTEKKGRDFKEENELAYLKKINEEDYDEQPNVIIVLADDLGYGDLSFSGSTSISTPNLDYLAENGTFMTNYYSPSPISSPSRAGLLTGRYPTRTHVPTVFMEFDQTFNPLNNVLKLFDTYSYDLDGIPSDEILLPEVLQAAGYDTAMFGKWHLGIDEEAKPNANGFDLFVGALYSNDMNPYRIYENDKVIEDHPYDQSNLTKLLTEKAISFLDEQDDEPFFMYYASPFPHYPAIASDDFDNTSQAGVYGDCVQELDWSIGQILETLEENGQLDNTLIIFTSDNGPWYEGSTGGQRGRKGDITSGGQQVPFIAYMPGYIEGGRISDELISGLDVFPTVLNMAGIELPDDRIIDGVDFTSFFSGAETSPRHDFFFQKGKKTQAVLEDDMKYMERMSADMGMYWMNKMGPFLFDTTKADGESYDVTALYPDKAQALKEKLEKFQEDLKTNLRGWIE